MTQPTPAPSGANTGTFGGITLTVPDSKNSKKNPDLYGVGDWRSQTVNPGDLPVTVDLMAGQQGTTADNIVKAFASGKPDQVATIQHALYMAGSYYPANYTPQWGIVGQQDIRAFAEAVKTAGQGGHSVSDLLSSQAQAGATLGVQAAQQQTATRKASGAVQRVTLPNTQDLEAEAEAAFQKILGRKPKPQEASRFAAFYRSMAAGQQRAQAQAEFDAQNPSLPDPLANADAGQLVQQAAGEQVGPFMGPVGRQGAGGVDQDGHLVAPMMGPVAPGQARPWVDPQTGAVQHPSFSSQIGGLMSLGQAVAAAQQAPGSASGSPGLQFVTEDSLPSANVAAENFARNTDPKGAAANDMASTFSTFLGLIGKSFG